MTKLALTILGSAVLVGFAMPASAHDQYRHDWQHQRLDQRHDDVHDRIGEEHDEAHEQGLSPWEHSQLHRELDYRHEDADARLRWQHAREHQRNSWQYRNRYYPRGGYYGW